MWKIPLLLTFTLLIFVAFFPCTDVSAQTAFSPLVQSSANDLIAEVNALRIANGLPAYTVNSILMRVAQDQANFMAVTGQVAHRPGLTQRILDAGYPLAGDLSLGGFRAENITGGNKTAGQAVQEWTGDSLHLNTMLSPNLTEIGAGVAKVGNRYYMVIDCAQPTTSRLPQAYTPVAGTLTTGTSAPSDFIVPITTSTPDEDGFVYHEVQYGQTLWAIAIEYGVKIDDIRALNNLGPTTEIYEGERLLVKKDIPPPTATATIEKFDTSQFATMTNFPTATTVTTETPTIIVENRKENLEKTPVSGSVIGLILLAILFAGLLSWMSSRRSS